MPTFRERLWQVIYSTMQGLVGIRKVAIHRGRHSLWNDVVPVRIGHFTIMVLKITKGRFHGSQKVLTVSGSEDSRVDAISQILVVSSEIVNGVQQRLVDYWLILWIENSKLTGWIGFKGVRIGLQKTIKRGLRPLHPAIKVFDSSKGGSTSEPFISFTKIVLSVDQVKGTVPTIVLEV